MRYNNLLFQAKKICTAVMRRTLFIALYGVILVAAGCSSSKKVRPLKKNVLCGKDNTPASLSFGECFSSLVDDMRTCTQQKDHEQQNYRITAELYGIPLPLDGQDVILEKKYNDTEYTVLLRYSCHKRPASLAEYYIEKLDYDGWELLDTVNFDDKHIAMHFKKWNKTLFCSIDKHKTSSDQLNQNSKKSKATVVLSGDCF